VSLLAAVVLSCGGGSSGGGPPPVSGPNVIPVTVNGALCSSGSYVNKPCVSVTVCAPSGSPCQKIDDILLDTGSYGLRIFRQVLSSVALEQVTVGSLPLAQCTRYADASSQWGPVEMAAVVLGSEPAVTVPVQVVDATFGTLPSGCANAQRSPADGGYNGVLGVGPFAQDCGSACVTAADLGVYYTCSGSTCSGTTVPLSSQVTNPVALVPLDNNGLAVELPSVPAGGAVAVNGSVILGIGTRTNNVPQGVDVYPVDARGDFVTSLDGASFVAFLDTGSNGLFFGSSSLPQCASPDTGWYCPANTTSFAATNAGAGGSPSSTVDFQIANFDNLINSSNSVFADVGGIQAAGFDWGLPFHLGRTVYVGLENGQSSLGSGPFFAY